MASQGGHPGRTLIALAVIIAGLAGLMALSHNWTPKLGLDLRGGTTITLTAQNTSGGDFFNTIRQKPPYSSRHRDRACRSNSRRFARLLLFPTGLAQTFQHWRIFKLAILRRPSPHVHVEG